MFSWMTGGKAEKKYESVSEGLKSLYKEKLLPLETEYNFHAFHSPVLDDQDFSSKPMVMLAGQYSTGKTTFIRHLLGKVVDASNFQIAEYKVKNFQCFLFFK